MKILSPDEISDMASEDQLAYMNEVKQYSMEVEKKIVSLETEKAAIEKQADMLWADLRDTYGVLDEDQLNAELQKVKDHIDSIHNSLYLLEDD